MSKKLSRRRRKMTQKKSPRHTTNDNFDVAISRQETSPDYNEKGEGNKKQDLMGESNNDHHDKDIYNPRQIKLSFILSLTTFSLFFIVIILIYYIDKKYGFIKHIVESL